MCYNNFNYQVDVHLYPCSEMKHEGCFHVFNLFKRSIKVANDLYGTFFELG